MVIKNKYSEKNYIYVILLLLDTLIFYIFCRNYLISNSIISIENSIYSLFILIFWLIINYILGSYIFKDKTLFNAFFKLIFNYSFAIILYLPFIIILCFNNPFEHILNIIFAFSKLNFASFCMHFLIFIINSFRNRKPLIWLFIGDQKTKENLILECKKSNYKTNIEMYADKKDIRYSGLIIEDNFKDIKSIDSANTILLSEWLGIYLKKYPIDLLPDSFFLNNSLNISNSSMQMRIKDVFERLISINLLIVFLPLVFISSIFIFIEDGLPIFYKQNRNGIFNKLIKITKLRTMKSNAEEDGVQWSKKNDARITNVGNFIRKVRIDELPQLISVIKGEMSLIGPRPERPEIDLFLSKNIKNYNLRYNLKPGLSGWAQVNYPYGASLQDAKNKFSYDLYYIKHFSNLLDIRILFMTIKLVFNAKGAIAKK